MHISSLSEEKHPNLLKREALEIYERRGDKSVSPEEPLKWAITSENNTANTHMHSFFVS